MRNLTLRLLVGVLMCSVGIAAASMWSSLRNSPAEHQRCRDGLVVIEQQPDAPVSISMLSVDCTNDFAYLSYQVRSRTTRLIKSFEIHRSDAHRGIVDYDAHGSISLSTQGAGMTASDLENQSGGEGVRLSRGWFREPVDELRLCVWSVKFGDGTEWHRAPTGTQ